MEHGKITVTHKKVVTLLMINESRLEVIPWCNHITLTYSYVIFCLGGKERTGIT